MATRTSAVTPTLGSAAARRDCARVWRCGILGGLTLMHVRYRRQRFRPHRHDDFTIGAVFEGELGIAVEGGYRRIAPGDFSFLAPGELHAGECLSAELQYRTIYVHRRALEQLAGLEPESGATVVLPPQPRDAGLLRELVAAHQRLEHDHCAGADLEAALAEIVRRFGRLRPRASTASASTPQHPGVGAALELIEHGYAHELDLVRLARRARLSVYHFLRAFTRETGLTPHSYLIWRRVERAKELLLAGLPAAETAIAVGFYDQSHLGRHFRSVVGATTGEFVAAGRG